MKVLIIEDDPSVGRFIFKGLKEHGHFAEWVQNGKEGLMLATTEHFDVIVLDRMLPEMDGIKIIQTLRASDFRQPILILSALDKVSDKVKGLKTGSDDYLVKPFSFEELLVRLEVLVNRQHNGKEQQTHLTVKDLEVNCLNRTVSRGGQKINLQAREYNLLEYLLRHKGQVVTRTMMLEHLWDYAFDPQTNVIDVHVSRLRNKIDKDFDEKIISTVRGAGYIIDD